MTERQYVSVSELSSARTCRHKWWLHYNERLTPIQVQEHFRHGSAVHQGAELVYLGIQELHRSGRKVTKSGLCDLGAVGVEQYFNELGVVEGLDRVTAEELARDSVDRLVNCIALRDAEECEVVSVEESGRVPLLDVNGTDRSRIDFKYLIDVLLRDRETRELIVVDHKTTSGSTYDFGSRFEVDPQMPGYVYATAVMHDNRRVERVGRARFNVLRSTGPKEPQVLKDGSISAKRVDTTRGIYIEAHKRALARAQEESRALFRHLYLLGNGEDKGLAKKRAALQKRIDKLDQFGLSPKQKELVAHLPTDLTRWVSVHEYRYTPEEVERWRQEAWDDARMIRDMRSGRLSHSRNGSICGPSYTMDCGDKQICCDDSPGLRKALYTIRPKT